MDDKPNGKSQIKDDFHELSETNSRNESGPSGRTPELWEPRSAAVCSIVLTNLFGPYIHAKNAEALGRTKEAQSNMVWFYISLGLVLGDLLSVLPTLVYNICWIVLLVVWYIALGRKQVVYVKTMYGVNYAKKKWGKPVVIAIACVFLYIALLALKYQVANHLNH